MFCLKISFRQLIPNFYIYERTSKLFIITDEFMAGKVYLILDKKGMLDLDLAEPNSRDYNINSISNYQAQIFDSNEDNYYRFKWWHFIYKIPRRW